MGRPGLPVPCAGAAALADGSQHRQPPDDAIDDAAGAVAEPSDALDGVVSEVEQGVSRGRATLSVGGTRSLAG